MGRKQIPLMERRGNVSVTAKNSTIQFMIENNLDTTEIFAAGLDLYNYNNFGSEPQTDELKKIVEKVRKLTELLNDSSNNKV